MPQRSRFPSAPASRLTPVVFAVCLTMGILDNWPFPFASLIPSLDGSSDVVQMETGISQRNGEHHMSSSADDQTVQGQLSPVTRVYAEPLPVFDPLPRSLKSRAKTDRNQIGLSWHPLGLTGGPQ